MLDGQDRYQSAPVNPDGRYYSTVLADFWLQVDWIWVTEPPAVLQALTQIVGPQKLLEAIGGGVAQDA